MEKISEVDKYAYRYTRFYTEDLPKGIRYLFYYNPKTILDLGAGDGAIIYALHKQGLLKDKLLYASEISPIRLKKIKELKIPRVICSQEDATDLWERTNDSIDTIYSNQVIEHVVNDNAFIDEMHRVLIPRGWAYLSTVFKKRINMGYYKTSNGRTLDPTHVREYMNDDLKKKLQQKFIIVYEDKTLQWFSVTDFLLKRLNLQGYVYEKHRWLAWLRKIKLPIIGYYNWEFILWKP